MRDRAVRGVTPAAAATPSHCKNKAEGAGVDFLVVGVVVIPLLVLLASLALVPYGR